MPKFTLRERLEAAYQLGRSDERKSISTNAAIERLPQDTIIDLQHRSGDPDTHLAWRRTRRETIEQEAA
jgi:hypothetical protein